MIPRPSALAVLVEGKKARGILGAIPAEPRIENRECDPRCSLERNKDRLAHQLKVANRARFVAETLSRGLRHRRRGSGTEKCFTFQSVPLRGFQRAQSLARLW